MSHRDGVASCPPSLTSTLLTSRSNAWFGAWIAGSGVSRQRTAAGHLGFYIFSPGFTRYPTFNGRCTGFACGCRVRGTEEREMGQTSAQERLSIRVGGLVHRGQEGYTSWLRSAAHLYRSICRVSTYLPTYQQPRSRRGDFLRQVDT
ncbi:hypothetical protein EXIGLDRAFT_230875 [Exidia glandulosa HHB12029]|uniref:Uncharacterized protein n=1 Tax=Exidia glandulosa HHB12029 TaxID=1314781 RepID=A0A165E5W9_EXIGL|nr:hypothetical protein EXIGLDRAFT_230875 [Exidia glandulosa HHB12029]